MCSKSSVESLVDYSKVNCIVKLAVHDGAGDSTGCFEIKIHSEVDEYMSSMIFIESRYLVLKR